MRARGEVEDRIVGLEFSATDYLSKPYSVKELLLRIKAHASRYIKDETSQQDLKVQHILLDTEKKAVTLFKARKDIPLTLRRIHDYQTIGTEGRTCLLKSRID